MLPVRAIQMLEAIAAQIYEAEVRGPGFVRVEIHEEGFMVTCTGERPDGSKHAVHDIVGWHLLANDPIGYVGGSITRGQEALKRADCA